MRVTDGPHEWQGPGAITAPWERREGRPSTLKDGTISANLYALGPVTKHWSKRQPLAARFPHQIEMFFNVIQSVLKMLVWRWRHRGALDRELSSHGLWTMTSAVGLALFWSAIPLHLSNNNNDWLEQQGLRLLLGSEGILPMESGCFCSVCATQFSSFVWLSQAWVGN